MPVAIIPVETLLSAYAQGIFPMADSAESADVSWYSARMRGVIPLDSFHMSHNVLRIDRSKRFKVKVNTRFREVMERCAMRETTWINRLILDSYENLHLEGFAHSVEVYSGGTLCGGLYGVALRGAFFGESMFKTITEADKIALLHCHRRLVAGGFTLWDTQFYTEHLAQFGCIEITAEDYEARLKHALTVAATF